LATSIGEELEVEIARTAAALRGILRIEMV
jgi:hypothetical protein